MKRVFLDASCWVAAAGSPTGGSTLILKLARAGRVRVVATRRVLQEAEHNIRTKMGEQPLLRYYRLLGSVKLELVPPVTSEEEAEWSGLAAAKDAHVLAGASKAKADALISLDRRHILTERVRKGFPIPVQDTGEFLRGIAEEAEAQEGDRGSPETSESNGGKEHGPDNRDHQREGRRGQDKRGGQPGRGRGGGRAPGAGGGL